MWILNHGEALLKVDPLQPAQVVGLIHCVAVITPVHQTVVSAQNSKHRKYGVFSGCDSDRSR